MVPSDPHDTRIGALRHDRRARHTDGVDVIHLDGVVVEVRDRAGLDQQVVVVGFDAHEREDAVEHLVRDLEAQAVQVEGVCVLQMRSGQDDVAEPAWRSLLGLFDHRSAGGRATAVPR